MTTGTNKICDRIARFAEEAGIKAPQAFSQQYLLLIGGASLMATIEGTLKGAKYSREALSVLIDRPLC